MVVLKLKNIINEIVHVNTANSTLYVCNNIKHPVVGHYKKSRGECDLMRKLKYGK